MAESLRDKDLQTDSPNVDWPIRRSARRPQAMAEIPLSSSASRSPPSSPSPAFSASNLPGQHKALSGISLRAFLLGLVLGVSLSLTLCLLTFVPTPLWRASFFLAALSLFHFLEYFTTARFNTRYANISAFLLSQNGRAYNAAHTAAFCECILTSLIVPNWQARFSNRETISLGFIMMAIGQLTRSIAMAQAGTNFNHTVQTQRNEGHELVKSGLYAWLRHPSYFGFFWWGVGTQVVMGNAVCTIAYTIILWGFFRSRIRKEEELLIQFFGPAYEDYRAHTHVGIPLIY